MARETSAAQDAYLAALNRQTMFRVKVEDPDGTMVDVGDLEDEDFFHSATIDVDADAPISRGTFKFWRASAEKSLVPLMEGSPLNRDSGGSYAPLINPARAITVEVAPMLPGQTPTSGDWVLLWEGVIDELDWAGAHIQIHARDRLALLNDTIIKTTSTYGGGSPPTPIQDVMQQILDDNFGSGAFPLTVVGDPDFGITGEDGDGYELGNVSVLEALMELANQQGWSLHYLWDAAEGEFRLTYYEPDRANVTPSYTFTADDYYTVSRAALGVRGIRNSGEVVYTDASGERQTVADERSTSIGIYGERFIRLDEQGSSIMTESQAQALLDAVLDDLEDPKALQELDAAFHWPIEVGDVHTYAANGTHYDTDQTYAVFGYTHVIEPTQIRTQIRAAGKPSGGFRRWHRKEALNPETPAEEDTTPAVEITSDVIRGVGATATDQIFHRDLILKTNAYCVSVNVSYGFLRPVSGGPATNINADYDKAVLASSSLRHLLEDGLGAAQEFLAQEASGTTLYDSSFNVTVTPYDAAGGASGSGTAGTPVTFLTAPLKPFDGSDGGSAPMRVLKSTGQTIASPQLVEGANVTLDWTEDGVQINAAGGDIAGDPGEDAGLTVEATASGGAGGHAFVKLEGDVTDESGEPGGAYLLMTQDGGSIKGQLGLTQGVHWPNRDALSGVSANDLVFGATHANSRVRIVAGNAVALTIFPSGAIDTEAGLEIAGTTRINGLIVASGSHDFGSIVSEGTSSTTLTATGAVVGDLAFVTVTSVLGVNEQPLHFKARVTGTDTVTIYASNPTGSAINPNSITFSVLVVKS